MAQLKDYSPAAVSLAWGGFSFEGFAEDSFVTASRTTPNSSASVGAQGNVGLTVSADKTGTIEVTLMQTSQTNRYLSAVQNAQDLANTLFRAPFLITDPSGGSLVVCSSAHLQEAPDVTLGSDQNEKTWVFFCEDLYYTDAVDGFDQSDVEAAAIASALAALKENSDKISL
jgi:hypothetical protein